jgi:hypothetical protein
MLISATSRDGTRKFYEREPARKKINQLFRIFLLKKNIFVVS